MRKLYSALLCISILMTSCSDSGKEDTPVDPNPLPDENAGNYVEFSCNLFPMTRATVAEDAVTEARLYAWGREVLGQKYQDEKDFLYGYTDCFFYTMDKATRILVPDYVTLTRNADDPSVWDYSPKLHWYEFNGNPGSFFAVIEPKDCKTHLTFTQYQQPHIIGRQAYCAEPDELNDEYYYDSGDLHDVMAAYTRNCIKEDYADRDAVTLDFIHLFPRVMLHAKLGDQNALDVTVKDAWIYGLHLNGTHKTDTEESLGEGWSYSGNPLNTYIHMNLTNPVKLTSEPQPLVDAGHEPHVMPQQCKAWTTFAHRDGAGIIMRARIQNMHDQSYLVGDESKYELVYVPFPIEKLEYGRIYNIEIEFGALYRDNGAAYGYQLSYRPQIVDWDTETENVELKK